ncbi:MAG: hypothetical protein EAZ78_08465 [Oscillatoriales cyanobacterium]|uniref:Uncharacterized protein n=1 Tax=Microcoleus anatoxicus PTRS2 TaxID=2705321 RepID=A0ABU8YXD9_9CYAN|nr:MAG: hypothetical protein EAZ96_17860 [Oscillatoriales cyanobacterium]TAF04584.1 MAG: hypothetical protein EAZ78_08465 [Oscillatoriales cyanobacterium]TAF35117.1 MAG: hypothetical protein EAZ68_18510 [Oscillatoriales cyanobacterium]TAF64221.1 MAG: hypothetical protein EAZ59_18820 [Oscillatoriales cyanobacterium]
MADLFPFRRSLYLVEFDMARAIASLKSGELVIPVWCDRIHQRLAGKLKGWDIPMLSVICAEPTPCFSKE